MTKKPVKKKTLPRIEPLPKRKKELPTPDLKTLANLTAAWMAADDWFTLERDRMSRAQMLNRTYMGLPDYKARKVAFLEARGNLRGYMQPFIDARKPKRCPTCGCCTECCH